jgi:quinol monooxygenase YgiN
MSDTGVVVVIAYQAQPGQGAMTRFELQCLIDDVVRSEADCLGITLLQDPEEDTRFLLYERWTSREVYLGPHMETPHLKAFIQKAPAFLAGQPAITFWTVASEVGR